MALPEEVLGNVRAEQAGAAREENAGRFRA
jgi:hypothetical protein